MPLVYGDPTLDLTESVKANPEALEAQLESVNHKAVACLWCNKEGESVPILVYPNAKFVSVHLGDWCEQDLQGWFQVVWQRRGERYALVLYPNISKSVERFKDNRERIGQEIPEGTPITVIFKPLCFVSNESTTPIVMNETPREVGFLDEDVFDLYRDNLQAMPDEAITWVGPLHTAVPSNEQLQYFDQLFGEDEDD